MGDDHIKVWVAGTSRNGADLVSGTGAWRDREFHNGLTYVFAWASIVLPLLGLVAIPLAVHGLWRRKPRAALALAFAVIATCVGAALWFALDPLSTPTPVPV